MKELRKVLAEDLDITEFDRDIMDSLIDKVVIGATDENGNPNPYVITFVFKAGMKFNEEFYEKVANSSGTIEEGELSTYAANDKQLACTYAPNKARGDGGKTTTPKPLILLEFKHFCEFFSFSKNSKNYHQKDLKNSIKIKIAI